MATRKEIESFWHLRADNLRFGEEDPCHYMNKWQDKYTFETRTAALKQAEEQGYFDGVELLVDIGCGVGTYTKWMRDYLPVGKVIGLDRPEFVSAALSRTPGSRYLDFQSGLIPSENARSKILEADAVTMLTVFDYMSKEDRWTLLDYFKEMKHGSRIYILDYFVEEVPEYQKGLSYKDVLPASVKRALMWQAGFYTEGEFPVNRIDSRIFHYLGKNRISYHLSKLADRLPFIDHQYQLTVFYKPFKLTR